VLENAVFNVLKSEREQEIVRSILKGRKTKQRSFDIVSIFIN